MQDTEFKLQIDGNILKGRIFFPSPTIKNTKGAVVLCHGIPGAKKNPGDPGYPHLAKTLSEAGYTSVIFNFRGAGESAGNFDIIGWVNDLRGVLDYTSSVLHSPSRMGLFGFSAGGAVSVYASIDDARVTDLILCGCPANFDSILSETKSDEFLQHTRNIGIIKDTAFPPHQSKWLNNFRVVKPEKWISQIKSVSKLILHGDKDAVVPVEHACRIYEKARYPKELLIIREGGHQLRLNNQAMKAALEWLENREIQASR